VLECLTGVPNNRHDRYPLFRPFDGHPIQLQRQVKGPVETFAGMPFKDAVQIDIACAVAVAEFGDRGGGVRYPMPG
jgi:hypothetical protein